MKYNPVRISLLLLPVLAGLGLPSAAAADEEAPAAQEEIKHMVIEAREVAKEWADRIRGWKGGEAQPTTYMGIVIESVPDVLRDYVDLPDGVGLLLPRVAKDGPAEKAGIQDNDILVKFDDQWIVNFNQLSTLIDMKGPGATVPVTILRKGEEMTVDVTLEERLRKGGEFLLPDVPDAPDVPAVPNSDELGIYMEKIDEWIPGSVRVFIDENEKVHVDLEDLKQNLGDLQSRLHEIHVIREDSPEIVLRHGDQGARTTRVHVADKKVKFISDEGRVDLNSSEAGKHVMVWDAKDALIYEGPLPEDYQAELPEKAVQLIDQLEGLQLDAQTKKIEVELNTEAVEPVTMITR